MKEKKEFWEQAHLNNNLENITGTDALEELKYINLDKNISNKNILVVGVGNGNLVRYLNKNNKVDVLDISENAIINLDNNHDKSFLDSNNLDDKKYDIIECNLVLQHMNNNDVKILLNNLYRALKEDGILAFQFIEDRKLKYQKHNDLINTRAGTHSRNKIELIKMFDNDINIVFEKEYKVESLEEFYSHIINIRK